MSMRSQHQPDWICHECGVQWGRWYEDGEYLGPNPYCATYHMGECGVCRREKSVTEPRDYGLVRRGWNKSLKVNK